MAQVYKSDISLTLTIAMVTKWPPKMLKIGNLPFWGKFETFDRAINIEHKEIQKKIF